MDIKSVNMKDIKIIDDKINESVDRDNHVSDQKSAQARKNTRETDIDYPIQTKAVFAIDEDKNVVIQLLDKDGEVVRQMPPEDYLDMVKNLKAIVKSHYDIEA